MSTVNSTNSPAIRFISTENKALLSEPMSNTYTDFVSPMEPNTQLLKEMSILLADSNAKDPLDALRVTLNQYVGSSGADDVTPGKLHLAVEQLKTANANAQPSDDVAEMLANQNKRVEMTARALGVIQHEVAINRTKANFSVNQFKIDEKKALQAVSPQEGAQRSQGISTQTSYAELWSRMAKAIGSIKSEYVDFYADLMQKYTDMYEAYNNHVQGGVAKAVSSGSDGNNVHFDLGKMDSAYVDFRAVCSGINLGSVKNWDDMTSDEQKNMIITLEPAFKITDGNIAFNLDAYSSAPGSPSGINKNGHVSTTSYQAWLAAFNAGGSALQSNMQSFAQRYSQSNSTFDNLNKVLSGAIAALADSAKDVIKAFS